MKSVISVAVGILLNSKREVLIALRPQHVPLGGLWEFPGGKFESGETGLEALERELHEEIGITVQSAKPLIQITQEYPDRNVFLDVWLIQEYQGEPHGREGQELAWVGISELSEVPFKFQFPAGNYKILEVLKELLY